MHKITLKVVFIAVITNVLATDIGTDDILLSKEIDKVEEEEEFQGNVTDKNTQKDDRLFFGSLLDRFLYKPPALVDYRPVINDLNSEIRSLLQSISTLSASSGSLLASANLLPIALAECNALVGTLTMTTLGTGRYYFSDETTFTWHAAQEFCRTRGLQLVTLETPEENTLVKAEISRRFPGVVDPNRIHWIGMNDLANVAVYIWTGSGLQTTYFNWASNAPTGLNEHCIGYIQTTNANTVGWDDADCDVKTGRFICEVIEPCLMITSP